MLVTTSAVKFKTFDDSKNSIVQLEVIISLANDELPKLRGEIITLKILIYTVNHHQIYL